MTYRNFDSIECDEDGVLAVSEEVEASLAEYLGFHGLRLPTLADATHTLQLGVQLRLDFGQAIRLAALNQLNIHLLCPDLSRTEIAYARAVARQDWTKSRQYARQVFRGEDRIAFFY